MVETELDERAPKRVKVHSKDIAVHKKAVEDVIEYWRKRLADAATLQLPCDFSRDNLQFAEAEEVRELSESVCRSVLRHSMDEDVRPFTLVLSAFSVLLHKYTREESLAIGSSSSAFNPHVLRVDVSDDVTLGDIIQRTKDAEREAEEHDVPFDKLVRELFPTQDANSASIFQVRVFNVVDVNATTLDAAHCDWTLYVDQVADSKRLLPLRLRVLFNSALYDRARMSDMLIQMESVIAQMLANPAQTVKNTLTLTDSARVKLPNPSETLDDSWHGAIYEKLSERAREHPDRPLVVHNRGSYSYKQVNDLANRVANFLLKHGIEKEERVALYAHRSAAIVVGIMAILKSGATFTVVDPAYPVKRQIVYLQVAKPRAVITLAAAGGLNAEVQQYIDTELDLKCQLNGLSMEDLGVLEGVSTSDPGVVVGPDNIGTLSFTSGSTGLPKAVRGRHISLTHFYPWMSQEFGMGEHDRFSMLSGIAHDPIQRDVFTPIFMGASIYVPDADDIGNPGALAKWVAAKGVSVVHLTPAMGQLLTANATTVMESLKVALFVGDVLTKRDIKRLQRLAPHVVAVNMYGTTETQRAVSFLKVPNDGSIEVLKEILPAGRGMKDVQLVVLGESGTLAGIGELGELYVRSPHMSAGYLGLPDATAEKFLVSKFTNQPADRFYRTGDLGRYLPSGIVECIGRADDQVKIRGFRIELGEIDTYLGQHPDVRENKTLVMRDSREEKQIISFFVPLKKDYSIENMRKYLATKLPVYSIPTVLCPITKMPLTPNGKVDKNKLPYPDRAIIMAQRSTAVDQNVDLTPVQKELQVIWEDVLACPVGPKDNFFHIGGHSILATRLTFQMREALKQDLPLNLLYQYPTIERLAEAIQLSREDPSAELPSSGRENADVIDLEKELILDAAITGEGRTYVHNPNPQNIFLTGATGFLGAFLLQELLDRFPTSVVRCLVRAKSEALAHARLVDNLKNHGLWQQVYERRIVGVVGDLGKARLGLSEDQFASISKQTEVIFHNGAMVHWVYPYAKLKPMNVGGTIEVLRMSIAGKTMSPVHFVSSTSVFDSPHYGKISGSVMEDDPLVGGEGLTCGYGQSKWISERLLLLASSRGVPMTIFRPGYITGHSKTGVMNVDDFLVRLLKGCLQLGSAPLIQNVVNMCSVDFVASAIVHVGTREGAVGRAYHVYNPNPFRFSDFFASLKTYGFQIEFQDYLMWRDSLMKMTLDSKDNALYPLLHFVLDDLPTTSKSPRLDFTNLSIGLNNSDIHCHPTQDLMGLYLSYLVQSTYFDKPTLTGAKVKPLPDIGEGEKHIVQRSERKL